MSLNLKEYGKMIFFSNFFNQLTGFSMVFGKISIKMR